jgi:hypothetical protein
MNETKLKRRWFRFSLRTLFVLVTILCLWLGYQVNWIWQRREFVRKLRDDSVKTGDRSARTETLQGHDSPTIPWIRRVFGDQAYSILVLPKKYSPELIERANDLFPEALVHQWGGVGSDGWQSTIDVTRRSENKRSRDNRKPLQTAAHTPSFPTIIIPIKDKRTISIRDESIERAMQMDRLQLLSKKPLNKPPSAAL